MQPAADHVTKLENELAVARARERRSQQEGLFLRGKLDQLAGALETTSRSAAAMWSIVNGNRDFTRPDQPENTHKLSLRAINDELGMAKTMLWRFREMEISPTAAKGRAQTDCIISEPALQSGSPRSPRAFSLEPTLIDAGWRRESGDCAVGSDIGEHSASVCQEEVVVMDEDNPPYRQHVRAVQGNELATTMQDDERRRFGRLLKAALAQQRESMEKREEARLRELSDLHLQLRREHRRRHRGDEMPVVKSVCSGPDDDDGGAGGKPKQEGDGLSVEVSVKEQACAVVEPFLSLSLGVPLLPLTIDVRLMTSLTWNTWLKAFCAWLELDSQTSTFGGTLRICQEVLHGRFLAALFIVIAVSRQCLVFALWCIVHWLLSLAALLIKRIGILS